VLASVEDGDDLAPVVPFLDLDGSGVPDRDLPAPYWPLGIRPSKSAYSSGWSSVWTARRLCCGSVGGPFGRAQETSTPSCSSRKSQCRVLAWCSWMTKLRSLPLEPCLSGIGSSVCFGSRLLR